MRYQKLNRKTYGTATIARHCALAFLVLCFATLLLASQDKLKSIFDLRDRAHTTRQSLHKDIASKLSKLESTPIREQNDIPSRISGVITQPSGPVHLFTVPTVLTYYEDLLPNNRTKLYIITSGILMKVSKRNLNAVACLVGDDIYPASLFIHEVLHCELPRRLKPDEPLNAVLAWDAQLKRAAEGPVILLTGVIAEILPGDIERLPNSAVLRGQLASAKREDFRVVRSDVRVGPSENFVPKHGKYLPRFRLCLMTMVAPNSHMLKDWADYHRRIGVDQVYIFDNGAARNLEEMFEGRIDVEIVSWPYHKSQLQAVTMFLFAGRSRCERVLLEDSDEYPMFGLGNGTSWRTGDPPLVRYAKKAEKAGFLHYRLLHLVMGNSGFLRRPKGEVPMNFIHRRERQRLHNGKSVCYTDVEWQAGLIHSCGLLKGEKARIYQIEIRKWGEVKMTPEEADDPPFLTHFQERSWEEYIEKWDAGRVSGKGVADEKAGTMTLDNPDEKYMRVNPDMEYTHFRDAIYLRVLKEGTLDEQTIVQTKGGKRCERLYAINRSMRELVREICK